MSRKLQEHLLKWYWKSNGDEVGRGKAALKKVKALKREHVNRALESIFDYPMTIVEAPMGYGKTTAVREFLALKGTPVIWTSFLSEDDTSSWFWERLASEIGKFDEAAGISLKKLGVPSDTPQTAAIISILNEMDYKPDTALAICVPVSKPVFDPARKMPLHYFGLPDTYMIHTFTNGGMTLRWFRDKFCTVEMMAEQMGGLDAYDMISREVDQIPPGCDGLVMLPHLAGAAVGIFDSVENAVDSMVEVKERTVPDTSNRETYDKGYEMYRKLFEDLGGCFERTL